MSEIGLVQGVIKEVDKISKSNASFYCFYRNFYFFRSDSLTHDSWLIDSFDSLILYTPRHTNFCKILWLWGGVSPLVFDKWQSNVAILTNFKVLFWVVSTDFPELVHVESFLKKLWKGLCDRTLFSVQPTHFPPILTPSRLNWFTYCTVRVEGRIYLLNCLYWKSSFM